MTYFKKLLKNYHGMILAILGCVLIFDAFIYASTISIFPLLIGIALLIIAFRTKSEEVAEIKKLAVIQVLLGTSIGLFDAVAIFATFSSLNHPHYVVPTGGYVSSALRLELLRVACTATIVVALLALLVVTTGVAHLCKLDAINRKINDVMLGFFLVLTNALALGAAFLTPIHWNYEPEALGVARSAMVVIYLLGLLFVILSRAKLVTTKKIPA